MWSLLWVLSIKNFFIYLFIYPMDVMLAKKKSCDLRKWPHYHASPGIKLALERLTIRSVQILLFKSHHIILPYSLHLQQIYENHKFADPVKKCIFFRLKVIEFLNPHHHGLWNLASVKCSVSVLAKSKCPLSPSLKYPTFCATFQHISITCYKL